MQDIIFDIFYVPVFGPYHMAHMKLGDDMRPL